MTAQELETYRRRHHAGGLQLDTFVGRVTFEDGSTATRDDALQVFNWEALVDPANKKDPHFDDLYQAKQGNLDTQDLIHKGYTPDQVSGVWPEDTYEYNEFRLLFTHGKSGIPDLITREWAEDFAGRGGEPAGPEEVSNLLQRFQRDNGFPPTMFHDGLWKEAGFTPQMLHRAGISLERAAMSRGRTAEDRYTISELKMVDEWKDEVDEFFTDEEILADLKQRAKANQVDLDELKTMKEKYLQAAAKMWGHRMEKRDFKEGMGRKSLKKVERDLQKTKKRYAKMRNRRWKEKFEAHQRELEEALAQLSAQKVADKKEYDETKALFLDLIGKRLDYVDTQLTRTRFGKKKFQGLRNAIKPEMTKLQREATAEHTRINAKNAEWASSLYPIPYETYADAIRLRNWSIGDGTTPENIHHPYFDIDPDKGSQRRGSPLDNLKVLEKKMELLSWSVLAFEAEKTALKDLKKLVEHSESLWKFVDKLDRWYPTFLKLGESVTEVTRPSRLLKGKRPSQWKKSKLSTGSRDFSVELGVAVGPDATAACANLGLSISVSGSLTVEDDRRLRAKISISLVPSFEVKIGGPAGPLLDLSAKMGFTVYGHVYAFVDARHFAYYMAFRIANLLNFAGKYTKYGSASLHQHVSLYSEDVQDLLHHIVGDKEMQLMDFYLTNRPVTHVGTSGAVSMDLGVSEGIVGFGSSLSGAFKPAVYQKTLLKNPPSLTKKQDGQTGGEPARKDSPTSSPSGPAPSGGGGGGDEKHQIPSGPVSETVGDTEYWKFEARGDGHCFFYSISFLLETEDLEYRSFWDLRSRAVEEAIRHMEGDDVANHWLIDTETFGLRGDSGDLEPDVDAWRDAMAGTAEYADTQAIMGAALALKRRIRVVGEAADVPIFPLPEDAHDCDSWPVLTVVRTTTTDGAGVQKGHYEPLFLKSRWNEERLLPPRQHVWISREEEEEEKAVRSVAKSTEELEPEDPVPPSEDDLKLGEYPTMAEPPAPAVENEGATSTPYLLNMYRRGYSVGASLSVSLPSWTKTSVDVGYIYITNHANPDNDGHYLNFKLTQGIFGRTPLESASPDNPPYYAIGGNGLTPMRGYDSEELLGNLNDRDWARVYADKQWVTENMPSDSVDVMAQKKVEGLISQGLSKLPSTSHLQAMAQEIFGSAPQGLQDAVTSVHGFVTTNVDLKLNMSTRYVEFNYVWDSYTHPETGKDRGAYRLQYIRWVYKTSSEVKAKIPVYEGIDLTAGASWGKTVGLQEKVGHNTLTYVITVFNGLKLRHDGAEQWKEWLAKHPHNMRQLFKAIGDGKVSCVKEIAKSTNEDIESYRSVWEHKNPVDGAGNRFGSADNSQPVDFVALCEAANGALSAKWSFSRSGEKKRGFRKPPDSTVAKVKELNDPFTAWLWRSQEIAKVVNERMNPWRKRRVYLAKPAGRIVFRLALRKSRYVVVRPPVLVVGRFNYRKAIANRAMSGQEARDPFLYSSPADVYMNRRLADAHSALPFYQLNFSVGIEIRDHTDSRRLFYLREVRQPDGLEIFQDSMFELARTAIKKRKKNLAVLAAVTRLHWGLSTRFQPWISSLRKKKPKKDDEIEAKLKEFAEIWADWVDDPNFAREQEAAGIRAGNGLVDANPDIGVGGAPPLDAFEELLKGIKGPFVGYEVR